MRNSEVSASIPPSVGTFSCPLVGWRDPRFSPIAPEGLDWDSPVEDLGKEFWQQDIGGLPDRNEALWKEDLKASRVETLVASLVDTANAVLHVEFVLRREERGHAAKGEALGFLRRANRQVQDLSAELGHLSQRLSRVQRETEEADSRQQKLFRVIP